MSDFDWDTVLDGAADEHLNDEIKGTDELKLTHRLHKTDEEIQRFTIDETLDEVDRACYLLRNGTSVQKSSIIPTLPLLFREYATDSRSQFLPVLLDLAPSEPEEFQLAITQFLTQTLEEEAFMPSSIKLIIGVAKKCINHKDKDLANSWINVFVATTKHLTMEIIENEVLPEALQDGALDQPPSFRIWCSKVLGALSSRLGAKIVETKLLNKIKSLCQDTDYDVRACMCRQLNLISKVLGFPLMKKELIPEYVELLSDEEVVVKETAIESVIEIIDMLDSETKTQIIIPQFKKMCEEQPENLPLSVAKLFGGYIWNVKGELSEGDIRYFISFYQFLAVSPIDEQRIMCAYNFPGIVISIGRKGFSEFKLDKLLDTLSNDDSAEVRRKLAAGFHEIALVLENDSYAYLKDSFERLLIDLDVEVSQCIIKNLGLLYSRFNNEDLMKRPNLWNELFFLALRRERELASDPLYSWRYKNEFLTQFQVFPEFFEADLIHDNCSSNFFKILGENVSYPLKNTAIRCLCVLLRRLRRSENRDQLLWQLQEYKAANSCHQRMLYLEISLQIINIFSHRFFKEYFFGDCIDMAKDRIANVRLKLVNMTGAIYYTLKLPSDNPQLQLLSDTLSAMALSDRDHEVAAAANAMLSKYIIPGQQQHASKGASVVAAVDGEGVPNITNMDISTTTTATTPTAFASANDQSTVGGFCVVRAQLGVTSTLVPSLLSSNVTETSLTPRDAADESVREAEDRHWFQEWDGSGEDGFTSIASSSGGGGRRYRTDGDDPGRKGGAGGGVGVGGGEKDGHHGTNSCGSGNGAGSSGSVSAGGRKLSFVSKPPSISSGMNGSSGISGGGLLTSFRSRSSSIGTSNTGSGNSTGTGSPASRKNSITNNLSVLSPSILPFSGILSGGVVGGSGGGGGGNTLLNMTGNSGSAASSGRRASSSSNPPLSITSNFASHIGERPPSSGGNDSSRMRSFSSVTPLISQGYSSNITAGSGVASKHRASLSGRQNSSSTDYDFSSTAGSSDSSPPSTLLTTATAYSMPLTGHSRSASAKSSSSSSANSLTRSTSPNPSNTYVPLPGSASGSSSYSGVGISSSGPLSSTSNSSHNSIMNKTHLIGGGSSNTTNILKKMGGALDINSTSSRGAGSSSSSSPSSMSNLLPFNGGGSGSMSVKDGRSNSSASKKNSTTAAGLPPIEKSPPASRLLKRY